MTNYYSLKMGINSFLVTNAITPYIYHRELPQNPSYPATVYDIIDQVPMGRSHSEGVLPFREARVQIDMYAQTVEEAENILELYFNAMGSYDGSLGAPGFSDVSIRYESTNPDMSFESEPTLRQIEGRSMDFKILYK